MKNKKNILLMSIGAITLIAVTLGATYAYFTAQSGGGANIDTNVITGTTDNLSFSFGDVINIFATEENFGQGMGSISDSTTGQAILKANNTTNEATARYNIYLIIENNDFVYTTENQTPEIVLNVTDPNGNLVENITGLVHYENGFDITTRTGGYLLVPDYEISATDTQTIQDWNIEVTLVNLDSDQNDNTNKSLTGKLYITQDKMSSYELTQINNIITSTTYNSVEATLDLTNGSAPVSKYYYGIEKVNNTRSAETVEYIESDETNYTFNNLEANTEYKVYSYVIDENKIKSNVYETNITTAEYEIPVVGSVSHNVTLNSITLNVTATPGSNEIIKYMYSKDNGASWEESSSNTHIFAGLTDSTEYKIKVKVVDSEGIESTEYYETITTEIYILPVVASVNATTTWNSITLTPSGTNGTNTIDHYEYSIDDGAYQESNVFSNLTDNTEYTIKVKAIDSIGRESNIYEMRVKTDAYVLPTITDVTTSSASDSITINVNAIPGDGSIVSYHYSRDDGSNYEISSSNSYIFSGLSSSTTYYIEVYVTDSNGRTSSVYTSNITTKANTLTDYIVNTVYTGTDGENGLYYHDGIGSYTNSNQEAGDYSYRYAGPDYVISEQYSYVYSNIWDEIITLYCNGELTSIYDGCSPSSNYEPTYKLSYKNSNDYTLSEALKTAEQDGYIKRLVNNFVCFGSDEVNCSEDNLYRIIGIFNKQVKLIKYNYATSNNLGNSGDYAYSYQEYKSIYGDDSSRYMGTISWNSIETYYWNNTYSENSKNIWDDGKLEEINLNSYFLGGFLEKWQNLIAESTWQVGGNNGQNIYNVSIKNVFASELVNPAVTLTKKNKIGLIYVSDYGYAASPDNWSIELSNYDSISFNNWMFMGLTEWTITPNTNTTDEAFRIWSEGSIGSRRIGYSGYSRGNNGNYAIRPTFYLNSDVELASGDGTQENPYRIS